MPSPDERPVGYKDICGKLPCASDPLRRACIAGLLTDRLSRACTTLSADLEAVVHEVLRLGSVVRAVPREGASLAPGLARAQALT